jgi:hypothetical protein
MITVEASGLLLRFMEANLGAEVNWELVNDLGIDMGFGRLELPEDIISNLGIELDQEQSVCMFDIGCNMQLRIVYNYARQCLTIVNVEAFRIDDAGVRNEVSVEFAVSMALRDQQATVGSSQPH